MIYLRRRGAITLGTNSRAWLNADAGPATSEGPESRGVELRVPILIQSLFDL